MVEININVGLVPIKVGIKKDKCAICHKRLHRAFPDDFPDEWKFCCNCKRYAEYIIHYGLKSIIDYFRDGDNGIDKYTFIKRAKKIDKLVNVV